MADVSGSASKKTEPIESNADRFTRIAMFRVTASLKRIAMLEYLGNKSQYSSTSEQVDRIEEVLHDAVDRAVSKIRQAPKSNELQFEF